MSDLSKSNQDINSIISDIESKDSALDNEIGILETKRNERDQLGANSESILEQLSGIEGEALEIAQQEIAQKIEKKANEIEESEQKIQEIGDELNGKKAELESGIEEHNTAIEEIGIAEKECDVDLSQSRDAASNDRDELAEASNKIDNILGKIDSVLSSDSAQKTTNDILDRAGNLAKQTANTINTVITNITNNETVKNVQAVVGIASILCSSVGYTMPSIRDVISAKPISSLFEKKDSKDRLEDDLKQRVDYMKDEEEKRKRRVRRDIEASIINANEPKISQQIPS
jgi:chromosome segregation ATPase